MSLDTGSTPGKPAPPGENKPPPEPGIRAGQPGSWAGLSLDDLTLLNEEIAGMARAGLPLDQGLAALAREMGRGRLQRATADLAADLQAGHTLPQALERLRGRVPPFYAGLVAAGVRTGRISAVLTTLTIYARTLADLRTTVIGALYYPAIVMALSVALFCLVFTAIIPQFEQVFRNLRIQIPLITEWTLELGRHPQWYLVYPLVGVAAVVLFLRFYLSRTPTGRCLWARVVYAVPIAGGLIHSARLAAFTELLGILVDHELPLVESFSLAGAACSDPLMANSAEQVREDLQRGQSLGEILRQRRLVPEVVAWMIGLGERRGNLGPTLHQVAEMYRRKVEMRSALLRSVLPPIMIIITAGVMVGLFVIAIMLPMFQLLGGLGGL